MNSKIARTIGVFLLTFTMLGSVAQAQISPPPEPPSPPNAPHETGECDAGFWNEFSGNCGGGSEGDCGCKSAGASVKCVDDDKSTYLIDCAGGSCFCDFHHPKK